MHFEARQQVFGGAILLKLFPPQISAHVCDAQPARSRLRHKDPAELDGTQRPRVNNGLPEGRAEQGCNGPRELERIGGSCGLGCPMTLRWTA